jgi:hypothetical protein
VIERHSAPGLWEDLDRICPEVATSPPNNLIVGIDDDFFVTEHPVTVGHRIVRGRTLFASLSLLKQLDSHKAPAIMAHEMAHLSGNDTTFSRKINPLLARYDNYLAALQNGGLTPPPIFEFMLGFRILIELSLSRVSRERELRAESIDEFVKQDFNSLRTTHPFDSHPPLGVRLSAVGIEVTTNSATEYLRATPDGRWFRNINDAEQIEQNQWNSYEDRFLAIHEESLAYRYLPSNDSEKKVVAKFFPQEC